MSMAGAADGARDVLTPGTGPAPQPYRNLLRETVDKLAKRPGMRVDGVWVWDLHGSRCSVPTTITLPAPRR